LASTFFAPSVILVLASIITMISLPSALFTIRFMPSTLVMFPITVLSFSCALAMAAVMTASAKITAAIFFICVLLHVRASA